MDVHITEWVVVSCFSSWINFHYSFSELTTCVCFTCIMFIFLESTFIIIWIYLNIFHIAFIPTCFSSQSLFCNWKIKSSQILSLLWQINNTFYGFWLFHWIYFLFSDVSKSHTKSQVTTKLEFSFFYLFSFFIEISAPQLVITQFLCPNSLKFIIIIFFIIQQEYGNMLLTKHIYFQVLNFLKKLLICIQNNNSYRSQLLFTFLSNFSQLFSNFLKTQKKI